MNASSDVEYIVVQYVPNVLSDKSVALAAVLISLAGREQEVGTMICADNWQRQVRILDPSADLEMLAHLLAEIRDRLLSPSERSETIRQLEDSFSNVIQVSSRRRGSLSHFSESFGAGSYENMPPPQFGLNEYRDTRSTISPRDSIAVIK